MRRLVAGLLVLATAGLLVAGCGGGGATTRTPSRARRQRRCRFEPESAILSLEDMPVGWRKTSRTIRPTFAATRSVRPRSAKPTRSISEGGSLPFVRSGAGAYAPGDAQAAMREFAQVVDGCKSYEEEGAKVTVSRASSPSSATSRFPCF